MAKSAGQVNGNQLRIYIETSKPAGFIENESEIWE